MTPTPVDTKAFDDIVGEEIVEFIFTHSPTKVSVRVARSVDHCAKALALIGVDEEMGAIRLIAAEEELVVAIFEWIKLKSESFPEHMDFVRKFKNHVVKLAFYPVLFQFRHILGGMIEHGVTFEGLEELINWSVKPVIDGSQIRLAILDNNGKELIRADPLSIQISHSGSDDVEKRLLDDLEALARDQHGLSLKEFLMRRADYRNKLLYATDAGSFAMGEALEELVGHFRTVYHDLLWVLAVLLGTNPPSKKWGVVSQFIGLYRGTLIKAGMLKNDNTLIPSLSE